MALNIIEDNQPPVLDAGSDDIAAQIAKYTSAPTPQQAPTPQPAAGGNSDPRLFYQSGSKKGQPRPPRKDRGPVASPHVQAISSSLITGALLIVFIDLLMPMLFAGINNAVSKIKVDFEKLQLSDKQKKDIEPIANEAAKYIVNIHPVALCAVGLLGMYTMQLIQLRAIEKTKLGVK